MRGCRGSATLDVSGESVRSGAEISMTTADDNVHEEDNSIVEAAAAANI